MYICIICILLFLIKKKVYIYTRNTYYNIKHAYLNYSDYNNNLKI